MFFKDEKILKKLFWCFVFNRAKTQFVSLKKTTFMPKSGIMVVFQLMLANYLTLSYSHFGLF
ncbi:hypothetical protein GBP13_04015 [Pediococcus acidilactici]|nr:hypothetical protein GBO50_04010 [Pediococcus acidilactici]KAF0368583.1 hypothetical protein GBO55_04710 [Pediococcus acidilactici]KAF0420275.1 hypothetical protein GBO80_01135 [Pediococcus acidilactici]KAF0424459.1 hypothetical protein GBO82_01135 [Pediococcus acidilactici]KAF0474388.1 hypothetical protein GBP08_04015 [Pediococcus acidilactici]